MPYEKQLTTHFSLVELAERGDPDAGQKMPGEVYRDLLDLAQHVLEPIRQQFGPLTITSGYRSPEHNAEVGGASGSKHLLGQAADIAATDDMQIKIAAFATSLPKLGGFGIYPGSGLVHVDIRPRVNGAITRWIQVNGIYHPLTAIFPQYKQLVAAGAKL